jgi:hypothetical protein
LIDLIVTSMSRIHGWLKTGSTQARNSPPNHDNPVGSSIRGHARRTTSSLTAAPIPKSGGLSRSPRMLLMCA